MRDDEDLRHGGAEPSRRGSLSLLGEPLLGVGGADAARGDEPRKAATRSVIDALHRAHDRVLVDLVGMRGDGAGEDEMLAAYFTAIERPVEDAALAMAAHGVAVD